MIPKKKKNLKDLSSLGPQSTVSKHAALVITKEFITTETFCNISVGHIKELWYCDQWHRCSITVYESYSDKKFRSALRLRVRKKFFRYMLFSVRAVEIQTLSSLSSRKHISSGGEVCEDGAGGQTVMKCAVGVTVGLGPGVGVDINVRFIRQQSSFCFLIKTLKNVFNV